MKLLRVMGLTAGMMLVITTMTSCVNSSPRTGPYEVQFNHMAGNAHGPGIIHVRRKNRGVVKSKASGTDSNASSSTASKTSSDKSPKAKPVYKTRVNLIGGNSTGGGVIFTRRQKPNEASDKN